MLNSSLASLLPVGVPVRFVQVVPGDRYYGSCGRDEFIFTNEFINLDMDRQKYVVIHELSHYNTSIHHDEAFYAELESLIEREHVDWKIAMEMEQVFPSSWEHK